MSNSMVALIGFVSWTMFLMIVCVTYRTFLVLTGKRKANNFPCNVSHGPDWYERLLRAHLNCVENLPLFAAIVLVAAVINQHEITDFLACWFLAARVGQSLVHLISTHPFAVQVRFAFFLAQYGILTCMIWQLMQLVW